MLLLRQPKNSNVNKNRNIMHIKAKKLNFTEMLEAQMVHDSKVVLEAQLGSNSGTGDDQTAKKTSLGLPQYQVWYNEQEDKTTAAAKHESNSKGSKSPLNLIRDLFHLLGTMEMLLLLPYFIYVGTLFTFWTGVYGPSLSFAEESFGGDSSSLAGLHGIMVNTAGMTVSAAASASVVTAAVIAVLAIVIQVDLVAAVAAAYVVTVAAIDVIAIVVQYR